LSAAFLEALTQDFEANGMVAIARCRSKSPARYLQIISSLLRKELAVDARGTSLEELILQVQTGVPIPHREAATLKPKADAVFELPDVNAKERARR